MLLFLGKSLMRLPIFAESIKKCDRVLKPHGVDIYNILMNPDKTIFDNILNSFVGIAAVQVIIDFNYIYFSVIKNFLKCFNLFSEILKKIL